VTMSLPVQEQQEGPTHQTLDQTFLQQFEDYSTATQNQYGYSLDGNLSILPSFLTAGETSSSNAADITSYLEAHDH